MRLQHIPLSLEELTDEAAATISGGVGISTKNTYRSVLDKYFGGSSTEDDTESTEESIQQASEAIQGTEALAKTFKSLF